MESIDIPLLSRQAPAEDCYINRDGTIKGSELKAQILKVIKYEMTSLKQVENG